MKSTGTTLDAVGLAAKEYLVYLGANGAPDLWLWEHSQRVMNSAAMLAMLPDVGEETPHRQAVALAALFHDAGWAVQVRENQIPPWLVLNRPTSDLQRELGAGLLLERCAKLAQRETLELAAEAIRQCNDRRSALPEAQVLSEAENLDEIGITYVLRQFRQLQAEGRQLEQLLLSWARQREYRFWDARINECLRWETTRRLARERLNAVEIFMSALARDREGSDVRRILLDAGIDPHRGDGQSL
jgi:hypothetical protein